VSAGGPGRRPAEPPVAGDGPARPALVEALGGKRGLIDSGLPAVVFVFVNAVVTALVSRETGLRAAIASAVLTGVAVVALRLVRKEPLQQALSGFFALAIAVFFAARSGEARDFFLPGIIINAVYALVFLGSVVVGRPLVGVIYAAVEGLPARWREDRRLRRAFGVATAGWSLVFLSRGVVQTVFYQLDRPGLLATSKLLMGWPLTIVAVAATLAYVKRARRTTGQGVEAA
jgi:intracellular septation protein A